jgi:hypothetical protein
MSEKIQRIRSPFAARPFITICAPTLCPIRGFTTPCTGSMQVTCHGIRLWVVRTHCCSVHFGIRVASISSVMVVLFAFNGP